MLLGVPYSCPFSSARYSACQLPKASTSRHPFPETMAPIGPFKLVTVNTAPDRAKRLIGRVVEDVKDKYTITHSANAAGRDTGYVQRAL